MKCAECGTPEGKPPNGLPSICFFKHNNSWYCHEHILRMGEPKNLATFGRTNVK